MASFYSSTSVHTLKITDKKKTTKDNTKYQWLNYKMHNIKRCRWDVFPNSQLSVFRFVRAQHNFIVVERRTIWVDGIRCCPCMAKPMNALFRGECYLGNCWTANKKNTHTATIPLVVCWPTNTVEWNMRCILIDRERGIQGTGAGLTINVKCNDDSTAEQQKSDKGSIRSGNGWERKQWKRWQRHNATMVSYRVQCKSVKIGT